MTNQGWARRCPGRRRAPAIGKSLAAAFLGLGLAGPAFAGPPEDGPGAPMVYPRLEGEVSVELGADSTIRSGDPAARISEAYPTVEASLGLFLTEVLSIQSGLVLEPVIDPLPGQDRFFGDIGLYAEEIFAQYEREGVRIFAGKFNPSFGTAWDAAPGVYGVDFAEDYELAEMIGGGGALTIGGNGQPVAIITANIFLADTTVLSESAFTNRGRAMLAAGGPANSGDLDSFSLTLDVAELPALPGIGLHLGARRLSAGLGDPSDSLGFVAAINGDHELGGESALTWIAEIAHLQDAEATLDDITYVTLGGGITRGPWNCAASTTFRSRNVAGGADLDDRLVAGSCGYEFESGPLGGFAIDGGVKFERVAGIESTTIGLRIARAFEFAVPR